MAFRKSVAAIAALSLGLALTAAQADSLRIGYNQWAGFAPVFVAADQGFFASEGIEVDLRAFPGPADSVAPLVAGHLDVALTTPDALIPANENELLVVAVMVLDASHGGDGIVAREEIRELADLRSKRIGVTEGEVNHLLLMLALEEAGLSGADVRLANMNADDAGAAFIAGQLDAAVTWEPWLSTAVSEGAGQILFTSADVPGMLIDVAAVTPQTLEARAADLGAFVRALDLALAYLDSNPDESHAIVSRWLEIPADEIAEMLEGIRLYGSELNRVLFSGSDPDADIGESFTRIAAFLEAQGLSQGSQPAKEMVDGRLFAD